MLANFFWPTWSTTTLDVPSPAAPFVNAQNALRFTPVYRAVTLIANDVARMCVEIDNPGVDALWKSPSQSMTAFELRRSMMMQALLWGNSFCAINRTMGGDLLELILLQPESVSINIEGGRIVYKTVQFGDLDPSMVFHLRAPSSNGYWGESPVGLCRNSLTLLAAQEEMALKSYSNSGNPKIAIVHPGRLSAEAMQAIEANYLKRHSGAINTGRPLVMSEGVKIERISSTLDDTGLESARRYSIADVSRIYGVPASYLSEDVGSSYGSMEWLSRMYADACLAPWVSAITSEIIAKLGNPLDVVEFDLDEIVRPSMAETMAALRTGVEAGIITRNEAREELDLDPLPGLDAPTLALNMGAGGGSTNIGNDTSANAGTANDF